MIDTDRLAADRDQLFAEAVHRYRAGAPWWPDSAFETLHIRPQQDARFEADVWQDAINDFISTRSVVTVGEIAERALKMPRGRIMTQDTRRITACLEYVGWERGLKNSAGRIPWVRPIQ